MIIRNKEHYTSIKNYFIQYINNLISKSHIKNKHYLIEIRDDLVTTGYLDENYKCQFFLQFLNHDFRHSDINIDDYLHCLKTFKKHIEKQELKITRITQHSHTLEDYLI